MIPIETKVMVSLESKETIPNNPLRRLNGQTFVVKRQRVLMPSAATGRRGYYELYGAESEAGIPYGFMESDLIVL